MYIQLPGSPEFRLLGAIANEKQTAIFRVNNGAAQGVGNGSGIVAAGTTAEGEVDMDVEDIASTNANNANGGTAVQEEESVTIGISVEPAAQVLTQVASLNNNLSTTANPSSMALTVARRTPPSSLTTKTLAQRIIKNAFNFLASFAGGGGQGGGSEVVPLKSFQDWWVKFERRIDNDPGFLEREEDG